MTHAGDQPQDISHGGVPADTDGQVGAADRPAGAAFVRAAVRWATPSNAVELVANAQ